MSRLEKNVLDDYDELMNFEHDTIGDLKYDLNSLKIRDRIAELQKENTMLVKENKEALEMVEKLMNDNTELEATLDDNTLQIKNTIELEKENAELKEQIEGIKYLDRSKLRNLIFKYPADEINEKELLDDICKLALPTREKIMENEIILAKGILAETNYLGYCVIKDVDGKKEIGVIPCQIDVSDLHKYIGKSVIIKAVIEDE